MMKSPLPTYISLKHIAGRAEIPRELIERLQTITADELVLPPDSRSAHALLVAVGGLRPRSAGDARRVAALEDKVKAHWQRLIAQPNPPRMPKSYYLEFFGATVPVEEVNACRAGIVRRFKIKE